MPACRVSATLLASLLAACASSSQAPAPEAGGPPATVLGTASSTYVRLSPDDASTAVTVDAGIDTVWSVLPMVYDRIGVLAEVDDPAARRYGTQRFTRAGLMGRRTLDYLRCAHEATGPSAAGMYRLKVSILTRVTPAADGKTTVETEVTGDASPVEGTSRQTVPCVSTGEIEMTVNRLVREHFR